MRHDDTPVDHGCRAPFSLVVDQDGVIICSACKRCWTLTASGWAEVDCHRDETPEG